VEGDWTYTPNGGTPQPGAFYSTRVSAHAPWIQSVLSQPIDQGPVLESASTPGGTYTTEATASINVTSRSITLPLPSGTRFFRLNASTQLTIQSVAVTGGSLVLTW
jgi:hypothetical protein